MVYQRVKIDDRRFNKRGGPAYQHKVRVIVGTKVNPISYGVTLPFFIADQFKGCHMNIISTGSSIILTSGCDVSYKEKAEQIEQNKKNNRIIWRGP